MLTIILLWVLLYIRKRLIAFQFLPSDRPILNLERNKHMLIQVITLTYPDGDQTTYVDQVGTEDASDSYSMMDEHISDGFDGSVKICKLVEA